MTRWIDITKREPGQKDMALSNRRGVGILIVCTQDGYVGEWQFRLVPVDGHVFVIWDVPLYWPGDARVTHWLRMPRPPGEFWSRIRWWFQKWRTK